MPPPLWLLLLYTNARGFEHLAEKHAGAGGEIQLTDALAKWSIVPLFMDFDLKERFDCGDKLVFRGEYRPALDAET